MADVWMGLRPDGSPLQIAHSDLMQWAYRNELQFTVGWSHHFKDRDGNRLVRGDHVAEARKQGWNDLADALEKHFAADQAGELPTLAAPYCAKLAGPCPDGCAGVPVQCGKTGELHGDCWRVKPPPVAGVIASDGGQQCAEK